MARAVCGLLSETLQRVFAALPHHDAAALVVQRIGLFFDGGSSGISNSTNNSAKSCSSTASAAVSAWSCAGLADEHASNANASANGKHGIGAVVLRAALTLLRQSDGCATENVAEQLFQCVALNLLHSVIYFAL